MSRTNADLRNALPSVVGALVNGGVTARNLLLRALPTPRPRWVVLELTGSYPARKKRRKLFSIENLARGESEPSLEELEAIVGSLTRIPGLVGVVLRLQSLNVDLATAYAVRNQVQRLRDSGKRTVAVAEALDTTTYYLAAAADEIVVPNSAELWVHGTSMTVTFIADALARFGIGFDKLAIGEYKNAPDQLTRTDMSPAQREQLDVLLDGIQDTIGDAVAKGRRRDGSDVAGWWDLGVTNAGTALDVGMVDRVAYEDEVMTKDHVPAAKAIAFAPGLRRVASERVALVSLKGTIVPGKSRHSPLPLPVLGADVAGSETVVRNLRAAGRDPRTQAVVFHVDSGGGSALASDLIGREIELLASRMPVVAVMGQMAASGGYYVLTHASRVLAAPTTLTGSIGVFATKPVLKAFNERYGLNPETLRRGRFATVMSFASHWDEEEAGLMDRYIHEVYERFVGRVAAGRSIDDERVDEIGRGRIWSGADAVGLGLVDGLGDVASAVAMAKDLAGIHEGAQVWDVRQPQAMVMPVTPDAAGVIGAVAPLLRERVLLVPGSWLSFT